MFHNGADFIMTQSNNNTEDLSSIAQRGATEDALLFALQQGIPFVPHPLATVGASLGLSEEEVVKKIRYFFETGKARRFGAIFDSRRLGYKSTLCAVTVKEGDLDKTAGSIVPFQSITHCYHRKCLATGADRHKDFPNLWFTVTARADLYAKELESIEQAVSPNPMLVLPAKRRFKIQVILDPRLSSRKSPAPSRKSPPIPSGTDAPALVLNDTEKEVVRQLQDNLSPETDPIRKIAAKTGLNPMEIVQLLIKWKDAGVLRRIGLIAYHQKIGFHANAMCVWQVPEDRIEQAGRYLAGIGNITHCYERWSAESFPYNLYAMVHTGDEAAIRSIFQEISEDVVLANGQIMMSVREYKKTSPRFFCER